MIGIGGSDIRRAETDKEGAMAKGQALPSRAEIGLMLYPGCQMAMVHGMTDLMA